MNNDVLKMTEDGWSINYDNLSEPVCHGILLKLIEGKPSKELLLAMLTLPEVKKELAKLKIKITQSNITK